LELDWLAVGPAAPAVFTQADFALLS